MLSLFPSYIRDRKHFSVHRENNVKTAVAHGIFPVGGAVI